MGGKACVGPKDTGCVINMADWFEGAEGDTGRPPAAGGGGRGALALPPPPPLTTTMTTMTETKDKKKKGHKKRGINYHGHKQLDPRKEPLPEKKGHYLLDGGPP